MKKIFTLFSLLAIQSLCYAQSSVLTIRPDAAAGKDASISNNPPTNNLANDENFIANAWTSGGTSFVQRSYIDFDLTQLPANAVVDSAFLYLYCNTTSSHTQRHSSFPNSPYSNNASHLRRVTTAWTESGINWNNQPTSTSQHELVIPTSTSATQDYKLAMTDLIKDARLAPTSSYGFVMQLDTETIYRSFIFASSDHPDSTKRPKLVVYYRTISTAVANTWRVENYFSLFPNPSASGIINFDFKAGHAEKIEVYDLSGKQILSVNNTLDNVSLDLSSYVKGMYIVKLYKQGVCTYQKVSTI